MFALTITASVSNLAGSSAGTPGIPRAAALVLVCLRKFTHTFGMVDVLGCSIDHGIIDRQVTSDLQ
jgi:hypothetical protein